MHSWTRRLAAVYALGALLACSSAGTCWLRLTAPAAHHCCEKGVNVKPAKPCASEVASVAPVVLEPPALTHALGSDLLPSASTSLPGGVFALAPAREPPLVLRI